MVDETYLAPRVLALQVAAERLLTLQGHEQRLEVALAEPAGAVPLDQLEEHCRPILGHPGEDLQQIALVVPVGEDAQLLEAVQVQLDVAEAVGQLPVVGVGDPHELDAAVAQGAHAGHDVAGLDGDVLDPRAAVEVQVLVDLGAFLALGRLVDGELDAPVAVPDDLGHQGRVLGRDGLVAEVDQLGEAQDPLVELDPPVHLAQLDVADHVVDGLQADRRQRVGHRGPGGEPGQERPGVAGAVDQRVDGVAVGGDGRPADDAVLVLVVARLQHATGAPLGGGAVGDGGVGHGQGDVADPVAVAGDVLGDLGPGPQRAGQHQPDRPLPEDPGGLVTQAGLGAGVGDRGEAEPGAVEVGRLLGVADPQLDVVDAEQGEGVVWGSRGQRSTSRETAKAAQNAQKGGTRCPHRDQSTVWTPRTLGPVGGLLPLAVDRPSRSRGASWPWLELCSPCTRIPTTSPPRARPPWPATPTRACGWWWSPAPAGRRARSSTRPWTSRGCWSRCPSCAARSWPRPWRSSASPPTTGSATATRAWPTARPTATPTPSPTPTWRRPPAGWSPSSGPSGPRWC